MRITITGPRSAGKSTVSKILATRLELEYIDCDAEADKAVQDLGGLNQAMIDGRGIEIVRLFLPRLRKIYGQDGFVFDLAGGATVPGKDAAKENLAQEIRRIIRASRVILLLPHADENTAVKVLQAREVQRQHFAKMIDAGQITARQVKLRARRHYVKNLSVWKEIADDIIYGDDKTPQAIADDVVLAFAS
jgi:adenylate kinase family enzyme